MTNIESFNDPISESILEIEFKKIDCSLPFCYKKFMLAYNGGITKKKIFLYGIDSGSILERLFGFTKIKHYDFWYYYTVYANRFPSNCIPIGCDPGGNLILLSVKGEDYGKVYFWDHEMETEPADYSNLTLIADSFEEFINSLKSEEEIEALLNKDSV